MPTIHCAKYIKGSLGRGSIAWLVVSASLTILGAFSPKQGFKRYQVTP